MLTRLLGSLVLVGTVEVCDTPPPAAADQPAPGIPPGGT